MPRLRELYREHIVPAMRKELGYQNVMQVPGLEKIVVNVGVGEALQNAKALDATVQDITTITGQKPIVTRARKSIANFKLREGNPIGVKVHCGATGCGTFWTAFVTSPCLASGISGASHPILLTAGAITALVCVSSSYSQRLTTTRLTRFEGWRLLS